MSEQISPLAMLSHGGVSHHASNRTEREGRQSVAPVTRASLCTLARPCISKAQYAKRFRFLDASLVIVLSGQIALEVGARDIVARDTSEALFVAAGTTSDLAKTPGAADGTFRSIFLTFSEPLLRAFHTTSTARAFEGGADAASAQTVRLDDDLVSTIHHVAQGIERPGLSDARLQLRLMELLEALAERGCRVGFPSQPTVTNRLKALVAASPDRRWTAKDVSSLLAMSEATLRRRLADEKTHFEDELVEVRMHHALMLLQTTSWSIPRVAEACGYLSRARFASRFQERFGFLPSSVR